LGAAQAVLGILGTASGGVSSAIGTGSSANIFNIASGAVIGALGFGAPEGVQKVGVPIVAGINGLLGILGIAGVQKVAGIGMNADLASNIIQIGIGVLGYIFTFVKSKK
jgi:hypothetical protein